MNNTKGGVGIEEFILNEKEFNQIRFYFNNSNLTMINFGSTDDTLTWVNDYSEKELLERFVMLYAHKYDKEILFITDENEILKRNSKKFKIG